MDTYEKKYNEALKDMRAIYPNLKGDAKLAVEHAFPELAESEDERIINAIIHYILYETKGNISEATEHVWVTWLEKQKKSLHIPETCKENADSFTDACKDVIVAIEKYLDWLTGYPDYAPKGKYSLRDMLYCLSILEKQKEQKPAEWSEEDERVWQELIYFFTHDTTEWFPKRRISVASVVKFLKSLRSSWKPSEEQMEALRVTIDFMPDTFKPRCTLITLQNGLEKLM